MKKGSNKYYGILSVILLLIIGVLLGRLIGTYHNSPSLYGVNGDSSNKVDDVMRMIQHYYVDDIAADSLSEIMISATLSQLDPHSVYLTADEVKSENEQLSGSFEGVGMALRLINDTVCVSEVFRDGPAYKAGFHPGDRIVEVDGITVAGVKMDIKDVVKYIRGPHHTKVNIAIKRYGESAVRHITTIRDVISQPSLVYAGMLDKTTGYVLLTRFSATSHDEFCDALTMLNNQGMEDLIIDLRQNGGGVLESAIGIVDELLPGRKTIVYTEGSHQKRRTVTSHAGGLFTQGRVAVLIDEYSASASEVVSGAIQDNDRGIIVGRRSFGKGLVQRQFPLRDGSAVLLTIAHYYTPSGRCIQRPYDKGTDEYYYDFLRQINEDYKADTVLMNITDSTKYYTTEGRVVYGGGGIYPDFILRTGVDTTTFYPYRLGNSLSTADWTFDYVYRHYNELIAAYPTADEFVKRFTVSNDMMNAVVKAGESKGIACVPNSLNKQSGLLKNLIKASIGADLYSGDTRYRILFTNDQDVRQTISLLKKQPK